MLLAILIGFGVFLAVWLAILYAAMTGTFSISLSHGQDNVSASDAVTFGQKIYTDALDVAATTSVDYIIAIDPDALKAYAIVSDQNIRLTTVNNPAGIPDVINLVAGQPLVWNDQLQLTKHFANTNPWTKWTFSNAPAAAIVKIFVMTNP